MSERRNPEHERQPSLGSVGDELVLSRLDTLLMRVLDEVASEQERSELLELADAAPELAQHQALRASLRAALEDQAQGPLDVVPQVLAALAVEDEWLGIADELRIAVGAEPVDLADEIMASLDVSAALVEPSAEMLLSAMVDGELSRERRVALSAELAMGGAALEAMTEYAEIGRLVRGAVQERCRREDLSDSWPSICAEIGVADPDHVPGWEQTAQALVQAVQERATLSASEQGALTMAILNGLPRKHEPVVEADLAPANSGIWATLTEPRTAILALAALFAVVVGLRFLPQTESTETVAPTDPVAHLVAPPELDPDVPVLSAEHNHGDVEEMESADNVIVNIIPAMEGAPLFLMIDEGDEGATL